MVLFFSSSVWRVLDPSDVSQTVKPIRGGGCGVAGGEKYLVAGMYIKFLIDHKGLYGNEGDSHMHIATFIGRA